MRTQVAIVGAGLSGLYAAYLLAQAGVACRVLESRDRIGGRILSVGLDDRSATPGAERGSYDLGPAWIWPDAQPLVRNLVTEMGIANFAQQTEGAFLVERSRLERPQRYARGYNSEPPSMRLAGGMRSLAEAVASRLPPSTVQLSARVKGVCLDTAGSVQIEAASAAGSFILEAEVVILAVPPRLASRCIQFAPTLPRPAQAALDAVPTWMAAHAKVLAIYERPFWRDQGYSGSATSSIGPLAEVHDASPVEGLPALFGFVGLPAAARREMGPEALKRLVLAQLVRLFGNDAAQPAAVHLVDWASDPDTATPEDSLPPSGRPSYGPPPEVGEIWKRRLAFAGTEVAPCNGGYLEGALEAAVAAVGAVLKDPDPARDQRTVSGY